jgi:DNA invertase Pin-like site-specific DNA recombinase
MIAAIYARKSTLQFETDPEAKSVHRQIANAKKFAAAKGWTVDDAHVYADDDISGAYYLKLAERQRLLKAVKARQVDVVIVRDKSRFTRRDGTGGVEDLMAVAKQGVPVWFYRDGKAFSHGTVESDVMNIFDAHTNSTYRRTIGRDVHEALTKRAEAGHVASGKVFGYDNVRHDGHAEYAINTAQAAVVVRIFQLAAQGYGFHKIAKQLTHDGVALVRPAAAKWTGWSGTSVQRILHNSIYRGVVTWNKTKKDDSTGKPVKVPRPKSEWIQRPVPGLRIVDEALWKSAHQQLAKRSAAADFTNVRPRRTADVDSHYVLTGFIRCECGSGMHVRKRTMADGTVVAGYACTRHYQKFGDHVCPNVHRWNMDGVNGAVLDAIQLQLTPDRISRLLAHVRTAFDARRGADPADQLRAELVKVQAKIDRLADAIEAGGGAVSLLVERMKAADLHRQQLADDLQSAEHRTAGPTKSWSDVERIVRKNVASWKTHLAGSTAVLRDWFRQQVVGPIVLRPVDDGGQLAIRFEGRLALSVLFGGVVTDERPTSRSSVDYHPVFQGVYRPDRRPPGRKAA